MDALAEQACRQLEPLMILPDGSDNPEEHNEDVIGDGTTDAWEVPWKLPATERGKAGSVVHCKLPSVSINIQELKCFKADNPRDLSKDVIGGGLADGREAPLSSGDYGNSAGYDLKWLQSGHRLRAAIEPMSIVTRENADVADLAQKVSGLQGGMRSLYQDKGQEILTRLAFEPKGLAPVDDQSCRPVDPAMKAFLNTGFARMRL